MVEKEASRQLMPNRVQLIDHLMMPFSSFVAATLENCSTLLDDSVHECHERKHLDLNTGSSRRLLFIELQSIQ